MSRGKIKRGRAAESNLTGRYERFQQVPLDDGWGRADSESPTITTTVTAEQSRTIIANNDSPDVPFERSINPYKGCEHGCIYCFARTTHAYLGLSPGLDFESRISSKPNAPELLRRELSRKGYQCREALALGANTDPYQPIERKLRITRGILEVLAELEHPVSVVTKSNLVLRDLDILVPLAERKLASVMISVTTLDSGLARTMEPRAPTPKRRLQAMEALVQAGVPVGVLASPMIPGLNDSEMEAILEASAEAGATSAGYILIRLPLEVKDLFIEWLEANYTTKAARVLKLVKDARGGELYEARFGRRMRGTGPYADILEKRFEVACRRLGLGDGESELDTSRFGGQGRLF
jgi:DNA repair photolyase